MNPQEQASLQAAVFRNTSQDSSWMGFWVSRHRVHEGVDEQQLAGSLGITMDKLVLLCLCRTPRDDRFLEDVDVICRRTGANRTELLRLLRQEQNLEQLKRSGPPSGQGWLMAASDRPGAEQAEDIEPNHEPKLD
jgi:hypothetical protein